jgi:hypothetical protein
MTKPFSIPQKLRILVEHGAVVLEREDLKPLHHLLWVSPSASKRWQQLKPLVVAVRCACQGELSETCDGTQWVPLSLVEFDHHLAHTFGGATHQRNARPLAPECHAVKSAREKTAASKADRIRRKRSAKKPARSRWPSRPLQSGNNWPPKKTKRSELHAQA